jgi:hypothetical protein
MAQIIPLYGSVRADPPPAAAPGTRTLRTLDVLLLLPLIAPLAAAIVLTLLMWFVAWLAVVALLVTAIVCTDLARRAFRRMMSLVLRPLDREAISYQGR